MALSSSRLATALKPIIESKIRTLVIAGDPTAYPQLTNFSQALAEAIAQEVVAEITANAVVSVSIASLTVNAGTMNVGGNAVTGTGNTTTDTRTGTIS
jgi:uncharacterized Fe-S cluster-containing radical SAM superfamily enzyme